MQRFGLTTGSFKELRKEKYLYIDKTQFLYQLIEEEKRSFLARPRRFGKSLLVSTLESILKGEKELFEGLWISRSDYNWQPYGVINLDFSALKHVSVEQWEHDLLLVLEEHAKKYDIDVSPKIYESKSPSALLRGLSNGLYEKFGQVALLIDEYDSPILHNLADPVLAESITKSLREFFMAVKSLGNKITFSFTTGISSFARTGFFSGMNNLRVLTLEKEYAAICGYTELEVDSYFSYYIHEWAAKESASEAQIKQWLKEWYNGYHFGKDVAAVYNPFSLMHALEKKEFKNFWFETGNPTFLIEELKRRQKEKEDISLLSGGIETDEETLGIFEVRATPLEALLFQTGYLTIKSVKAVQAPQGKWFKFHLFYPNYEVATSFQVHLLTILTHLNKREAFSIATNFAESLLTQNVSAFIATIKALFAQVPYQLHIPKESFYHALLQTALGAAGFKAQSEYATDQGRIDLVVDIQNAVYIIEVKFDSSAKTALAQIKNKKYYERFLPDKKQIILIGICFEKVAGKFDISYEAEILAAHTLLLNS